MGWWAYPQRKALQRVHLKFKGQLVNSHSARLHKLNNLTTGEMERYHHVFSFWCIHVWEGQLATLCNFPLWGHHLTFLLLDSTRVDSRFKIILVSNISCINVAPRFIQRHSCCSFLSQLRAAHLCCCSHSWKYTPSHCSLLHDIESYL